MRASAVRLFAALCIATATASAWAVACGDVLPVDADTRADGGRAPAASGGGGDESDGAATDGPTADSGPCEDCERLVFVTSQAFAGDLGGVVGADLKCRMAAALSRSPNMQLRNFKAWLSATTATASSRLVHGRKPYRRTDTDSTVVADDWDDLTDGTLDAPLNVDENGTTISGANPWAWTGTTADGGLLPPSCADWTASSEAEGRGGSAVSKDRNWTQVGTAGCESKLHLYCIEE